jgi:O-antigen/teichoic acid export membrane protein
MSRLLSFLDQETKRLVQNSSWIFLSNFYSTGLAFLRSVVIARGLGVALFGSYTIVVAFVGLVQEFLNLNLGTALIKYGAGYHSANRTDKLFALVKTSLRLSVIMLVVSVLIIAGLSYSTTFIHDEFPGIHLYMIVYAVASGLTYFNSISRSMLRLYYRFRVTSVIEIIMDSIETIVVAIVVYFYPKNIAIFFPAIIIVRFVNAFICNYIAYLELRKEWLQYRDADTAVVSEDRKEIRSFILGNSLGNTLKTIISQGDVVLLGLLTGPEQVAYYSIAKKLAYSILALTDPLASSIYPQLAKLMADQKFGEMKIMLRKIVRVTVIPSVAFFIVMYFIHQWVIVFLYGKEFLGAAAGYMFFLAGALLGVVTFWTLPLVQSLGLVRMRVVAYVITIVVGVVLSLLLIPYYQAAGMAIALLITNVLNVIIFLYFSFQNIQMISRSKQTALER